MFNLVRWYNQNRGKFWLVILIIFAVIFFVQVANNFYKQKNNENPNLSNTYNTSSTVQNRVKGEISGKLESSKSLIDDSGVSSKNLEKQAMVIDNFIKYCNSGKVQEAYNLLTDECKEKVFPTSESFKSKYYDNVFNTNKTYSVQNWSGDTYKVKLVEDSLTTGKVSSNSSYLQEYITAVKKDEGYKLNINNYIGRTIMNKSKTTNGITIEVLSKDTFMDYSEYTVKITNTSGNTILLDDGKSTDSIYLLDENEVKEYVNTGEIIYSSLELKSGGVKTYRFKFSNSYSNTRVMEYLVFDKVITDYNLYNETIDKSDYSDFIKITVNI